MWVRAYLERKNCGVLVSRGREGERERGSIIVLKSVERTKGWMLVSNVFSHWSLVCC